MNLILNRNFELPENGWYQLAPLGEFPHAAAGITQVIDEAACRQMVSAFETVKNASGNFPGLLIDFDHFSLDAAKHSEAAGWITDLKVLSPSSPLSGPKAQSLTPNAKLLTKCDPCHLNTYFYVVVFSRCDTLVAWVFIRRLRRLRRFIIQ